MSKVIEKMEEMLEWGGTKKDITCLVLSGIALIVSIFDLVPLPFDAAWAADYSLWSADHYGSNHWSDYSI